MRPHSVRRLGAAALLVALLALAAGPAAPSARAQAATPAGTSFGAGLPALTIAATAAGFTGVPASTAAGRYLVTFSPATGGAINFLQLPPSVSFAQFAAFVAKQSAGGAGTPGAGGGGNTSPPPWYYQTYIAGGVAAPPGQTAQAIVDLRPGVYAVWGGNPRTPPPPVALTVTGAAGATPTAGAELPADVQVNEIKTAAGYAFQVNGRFKAGRQIVKVVNASDQPHFMLLQQAPAGITRDQVMQVMRLPGNATPAPGSGLPSLSAFRNVAEATTQSAGAVTYVALDLKPGTYVLFCFIPDPAKGGEPHAMEGMAQIIVVP